MEYSEERLKIPMVLNQKPLELEPFFTKSIDWKYEEEVRMVATLDLATEIKRKDLNDIYLFEVPHEAIKEVIVGVNTDVLKKQILLDFCSKRKIKLFNCKISETKFNMERVKNTAYNRVDGSASN